MPLRNRMTPLGEPIAVEARGLVYANRGNMHDARKRIRRPFGVKRWIVRGRRGAADGVDVNAAVQTR